MKDVNRVLAQEIKRNGPRLVLVLLLMVAAVGLDAVAPWPFKLLVDNVLSADPLKLPDRIPIISHIVSSRYLLGFAAVLIYFLSTFLLSAVEYMKSSGTKNVIKEMTANFSKRAFENLEKIELGFYKKQQIGDFIYRLSYDVSALGEFLEDGVLPLLASCFYIITTISIMMLINFRLTLFSLAALPVLAFGLYAFNFQTARATKRSEFLNSATFSFIEEALTHLKVIQAFSKETEKSTAFDHRTETSLQSDVVMYRLDFMLSLLVGVIIAISYSLIILYGIYSVFSGTLTTGLLIVFIFYLDNLTVPVQNMIYAATVMKQSYVKITRMNDFFKTKTHLEDLGTVTKVSDTSIMFSHVSLKLGGQQVLRDVSFVIPAQKRTVIFGINGSGKTSVVNLLLRFIERPTSGKILIGSYPLEEYNIQVLRNKVAYVPQEISLFDDSIYHNIAFGADRTTRAMVEEAAHLAAADEFIEKLPGKYQFKVGEGGTFLSGGQKQRIMLARALMKKKAKIMLLDETLSALDVAARHEVIQNLRYFAKGKTMIIVSHVFEIARLADHAIVLDRGRVVYSGPTAHLHREAGLYKMMTKTEK